MSRVEAALAYFDQGYNCAQAIFATYAPDFGGDRDLALRAASGFGGGMARCGATCGAVTGAMLVIGVHAGSAEVDPEAKAKCYAMVRRFFEEFRLRNASIECRTLLGIDVSTDAGWAEAKARDTHHTVCPKFVRDAAEILELLLAA